MKKKIILPILTIAIAGIAIFGISQANAQTNTPLSGLAQMIAQKFGLDQNKVQSVVDQYKTQQKTKIQQNMQKRQEDRLSQLVKQGKITDSQKQEILDELAALKKKYNPDSLKNMTPDQRKQQFQAEQNELKSWATSKGIDLSILMPFGKRGMHRFGGFGGFRHKLSTTPAPTQ